MFDEKEYKAAFSKVTASGETHRRILNMTNEKKKNRMFGYASRGFATALMASLLIVTAAASGFTWFVDYFEEKSEAPLSVEQVQFIEENVQDISQKQIFNGYSMELKSVLTDGYHMFISIGITAPEEVYLDRTVKEGFNSDAPVIWVGENSSFEMGNRGYGATWSMTDDGDGKSNTHNLVYLMSTDNGTFIEGETIKIHIENLYAEYINEAYGRELEKKYGFEPKLGLISDEEAEKLYPVELLAEGKWDFEIKFEEINVPFVEVLDHPVDYIMTAVSENKGTEVEVKTKITSIKISPLGVICQYEEVKNPRSGICGEIVMKDGSTLPISGNTVGGFGNTGGHGMFSVPIALEEIDHIVLNNDVVIPMTE